MKNKPEYIYVTGAPGSKWSSVIKNIYWSDDVNHSDYSKERTYYHDADSPGRPQLMHLGAYLDPGMEFGTFEFDAPFTGDGIKIVKSHTLAHSLNHSNWPNESERGWHTPGCPLILVYRNDVECYEWWKKCGGFNITYPLYNDYYTDLDSMWDHIVRQNNDIMTFVKRNFNRVQRVYNNQALCEILNISHNIATDGEDVSVYHDYTKKDIQVYVYK